DEALQDRRRALRRRARSRRPRDRRLCRRAGPVDVRRRPRGRALTRIAVIAPIAPVRIATVPIRAHRPVPIAPCGEVALPPRRGGRQGLWEDGPCSSSPGRVPELTKRGREAEGLGRWIRSSGLKPIPWI